MRNDLAGHAVANWWAERLEAWCRNRLDVGGFVDQKWFKLVPGLFENVRVLRNPGYNVASWTISQRAVEIGADGSITVNGFRLGFYHFTRIGGAGDVMTLRYGGMKLNPDTP